MTKLFIHLLQEGLIAMLYLQHVSFDFQVSAHAAKRKIAETSTTPRDFLRKYDELKSKKLGETFSFFFVLKRSNCKL